VHRVNTLVEVPEEEDLCVRAARLLQKESACSLGVDILLEKHIPMGGGLGGGSSDAATTLIALNQLWSLGLSRERLMQLGLTLGADVPVFIFGENAFAEGVGEQLQAFALPQAWYVVLFPPVHVPTARIFTHPELTRDSISITIRALPIGQRLSTVAWLGNDLQAIVCKLYPDVANYLEILGKYAQAQMTGSGACVFAEFASEAEAQNALQQLPEGVRGVVTQGLQQHPLHNLVV
jgi:4-diphosphocytidyl-2-C-methyl-D-erythritol kinase